MKDTDHTLMTITEYAARIRPLVGQEVRMVEANIAAGNAVMLCRCGTWILALEAAQLQGKHDDHIRAVVAARRAA